MFFKVFSLYCWDSPGVPPLHLLSTHITTEQIVSLDIPSKHKTFVLHLYNVRFRMHNEPIFSDANFCLVKILSVLGRHNYEHWL